MISRIRDRLRREILKRLRSPEANRIGVIEHTNYPHSFIMLNRFKPGSVAIDVGCAEDADFSQVMIQTYGVKSFAVDPTRKHAAALRALEAGSGGQMIYCPYAVGAEDGLVTFYEHPTAQSGSLLTEHINIRGGDTVAYEVESLTIGSLVDRLGLDRVDILKLDIEGAEYDLLNNSDLSILDRFDQIFIEFHHHAVERYTRDDTLQLASRIRDQGFKSFTFDDHNFLFYRSQ
jgi:FkbM family methyltransferase